MPHQRDVLKGKGRSARLSREGCFSGAAEKCEGPGEALAAPWAQSAVLGELSLKPASAGLCWSKESVSEMSQVTDLSRADAERRRISGQLRDPREGQGHRLGTGTVYRPAPEAGRRWPSSEPPASAGAAWEENRGEKAAAGEAQPEQGTAQRGCSGSGALAAGTG